ncbi:antA/AntB antirepressor family protein [Spirosoma sp. SC4-14]|uniref:antA/AntB antirepressor family protein n=1 Tax=Spirosoma sp. SC4-14 TaxID=3128900 RepID=UPI0030D454E8
MQELITITTGGQGLPVVSARELHAFLEVRTKFASWIERRINEFGFVEGQDYSSLTTLEVFPKNGKNPLGGRPELDYALTLDMAKELSMVERNAKGKQARQYFIDAEKKLRQLTALPSDYIRHQEQRLADLEQQLKQVLDAQQQAARSLLDVPRSTEPLPIETTRIKIQRIVNGYCRVNNLKQQDIWRRVYDRLFYLYRVNIRAHKRSDRESWLDVAERSGHLEKIYAIVSAELTYREE